jgi:hypothetical protein
MGECDRGNLVKYGKKSCCQSQMEGVSYGWKNRCGYLQSGIPDDYYPVHRKYYGRTCQCHPDAVFFQRGCIFWRILQAAKFPVHADERTGTGGNPDCRFSYGAKNNERIKHAIRTVLPIAVGIALLATILFMAVPQVLLGFFSPSEEMLRIGVPALRIIAVTFIPASVTMVLGYSMSGLGNGVVGTGLRQLIIFVPLLYVFAKNFGIEHCWYAIWISEIIAVLYSIADSMRILKKKKII